MKDDDASSRRLFSAARLEQPSADARKRALRALLENEPGSDVTARRSRSARSRTLRRNVSLAMIAAACVGTTLALLAAQAHRSTTITFVAPEPAQSSAPTEISSSPKLAENPPETTEQPKPSGHPSSARSATQPEGRATMSLSEETTLLDGARQELARGDIGEALKRLDQYETAPPPRRLADEATLLRIEALLHAGRRDAAIGIAERFIQRNPNSPLVDRARALVSPSAIPRSEKDNP